MDLIECYGYFIIGCCCWSFNWNSSSKWFGWS